MPYAISPPYSCINESRQWTWKQLWIKLFSGYMVLNLASPTFPITIEVSFFFLNWIFYLFTFQMLFPFPVPPSQNPLIPSPLLLLLWGYDPTHSLPPTCHCISLQWGIEISQDREPLLPLMLTILCYIYDWSHGSFLVYSLIGGLDLGCSFFFNLPWSWYLISAVQR